MFLLAPFLWFAEPAPLEMPRATAHLSKATDGERSLIDMYDPLDLWTARTVAGRWTDDGGRVFVAAQLDCAPPLPSSDLTDRVRFEAQLRHFDYRRDHPEGVHEAVALLSPVEPVEKPSTPGHAIRNMRDVFYWQGTNRNAIVATFTPERDRRIFCVSWELSEGDIFDDALEAFEDEILRSWQEVCENNIPSLAEPSPQHARERERKSARPGERDLSRAAAIHSITNYSGWRATCADGFAVLDHLGDRSSFPVAFTNELETMRTKYDAAFPQVLNVSNSYAVARIFRNREEYLDALKINDTSGMEWSAAYWSVSRRELVAYLPEDGEKELLKTIRHEAFHQHLSYACCMMAASPWINEGYAQYFEDEDADDWGLEVDIEQLAELLPQIMGLDYEGFYDKSAAIRSLYYRTAWSIARFLEKGAPEVRFEPFKDLKKRYIDALLETGDMRKATAAAFGSQDKLKLFVEEWKKYWLKNM